jgi:hypothetical protein
MTEVKQDEVVLTLDPFKEETARSSSLRMSKKSSANVLGRAVLRNFLKPR